MFDPVECAIRDVSRNVLLKSPVMNFTLLIALQSNEHTFICKRCQQLGISKNICNSMLSNSLDLIIRNVEST